MADKTQLNQALNNSNATVLNRNIASNQGYINQGSTVLNPYLSADDSIAEGTLLCGKYRVIEKMSVVTGEADLYVCTFSNKKYVAKVYRRTASIKAEVTQQLKKLKSPYVATIYEIGEHRGAIIEILPFYSKGSLKGKTFSYEQLRNSIIPCLNEGLKALHDRKIIHKDLKPSNIMVTDDQQSVAIIDFGISSVTQAGKIACRICLYRPATFFALPSSGRVGQLPATPCWAFRLHAIYSTSLAACILLAMMSPHCSM